MSVFISIGLYLYEVPAAHPYHYNYPLPLQGLDYPTTHPFPFPHFKMISNAKNFSKWLHMSCLMNC